jgi:hypothetical protein
MPYRRPSSTDSVPRALVAADVALAGASWPPRYSQRNRAGQMNRNSALAVDAEQVSDWWAAQQAEHQHGVNLVLRARAFVHELS